MTLHQSNGATQQRPAPSALSPLEMAIWRTVAYVDVFDYPLTAVEIHRYLEGVPVPLAEVKESLENGRLLSQYLSRIEGYYTLAGREEVVPIRERRAAIARSLWPEAIYYGQFIAQMPFVRMVAVTGSLAMDNIDEDGDIDYLIVTENGRLWVCRAFVIAVVYLAARRGLALCPNYLLTERALEFPEQNLYTAHEVTQMIPLSGEGTYQRMRQVNAWTDVYVPNAHGPPRNLASNHARDHFLKRLTELPLRTPAGQWLDQWEMRRKIRKFQPQAARNGESAFSADCCKGHFDDHRWRTMIAYQNRLKEDLKVKSED